jgi:hypothetical protein
MIQNHSLKLRNASVRIGGALMPRPTPYAGTCWDYPMYSNGCSNWVTVCEDGIIRYIESKAADRVKRGEGQPLSGDDPDAPKTGAPVKQPATGTGVKPKTN